MDGASDIAIAAVMIGLVLAFGLFTFFRGFFDLHDSRVLADTPRSKCRSVALGLVELAGRAAGQDTLPSVVAGIPCYCSKVVVECYDETGESRGWRKVNEQELKLPFYVEDETGRVRVAPSGCDLTLAPDLEFSTAKGFTLLPEQTATRFRQTGRSLEDLRALLQSYCPASDGRVYRCRESNLCPGDPVFVLGTAAERSTTLAEGDDGIVIRRGKDRPWFIVAESSPREFLDRLRPKTVVRIVGGAVLTIVALGWVIIMLLH